MTTTIIAPAGYIVTDNELIHGTGETADAAWADAKATLDSAQIVLLDDEADSTEQLGSWMRASDLTIRSATSALIQDVADMGGAIGWRMVGGVACTRDEADGEAA